MTCTTNMTSCSGIALSMNPDTNCQDDIVIIANHDKDEGEGDLKPPDMWVVTYDRIKRSFLVLEVVIL
jgi:hypothetical protein